MAGVAEKPVSFDDLPGWREDDHHAAFEAFRRSAAQALKKPYRDGSNGRTFERFKPAFEKAVSAEIGDNAQARAFFETLFEPVLLKNSDGDPGLVTGFYEPIVDGSRTKSEKFPVPIYAMPDDLFEINEAFAVVTEKFIRDLELDRGKVNVNGGAIAGEAGAARARLIALNCLTL